MFTVKFCQICKQAWEYSRAGARKDVEYYIDFPSISCEKVVCPKCKKIEKNKVKELV